MADQPPPTPVDAAAAPAPKRTRKPKSEPAAKRTRKAATDTKTVDVDDAPKRTRKAKSDGKESKTVDVDVGLGRPSGDEEATKTVDVDGAPGEADTKKRAKRFWQLVDEYGQPLNQETKSRLQGVSPYQAALKAVTRFAEEQGKEYTFHLLEAASRARGKPKKIHVYKGWKAPLQEHEKSEFTTKHSITAKPHAKSLGTITIQADIRVAAPEVTEVEKVEQQ